MPRPPEHQFLRRVHNHNALDHTRRVADFVIASILLAITAPLMLLAALAIRLESRGPVLMTETCIGLGGRRFQMLKFRTVPHDPDRTTPIWSRKPTMVGKTLQHTWIEALPQLVNVLRG